MDILKIEATPIQKLSERFNSNNFYIKRDDLIPVSFGGNKARKAILFFQDILLKGADCIITYGSSSSNHCRIISNIAASKRLPCYIISPIETNKPTSNRKITKLFGAEIVECPLSEVSNTINLKIEELKSKGYNPYFIQGGGHGDIGTQAYVEAYKEIVSYEKDKGIHFDYIFHTSGTGTTQAGLICGQLIYGHTRKIIGISNARKNPYGANIVLDSVNSYLESIGKERRTIEIVNFVDDYVLEGYGDYNKDILLTIKHVLVHDGIPLDTTYTGKGYWGMKEYIKENEITGKNILFIHTGGTPLFFDDLEELIDEW